MVVFEEASEEADGDAAHFGEWLADGGERGRNDGGFGGIVEADD